MIVDLLTPAEHLHVDVLVHEDLDWVPDPQPSIYSRLGRGHLEGSKGVSAIQLPFTETVFELGRGISSAETLLMPWYRRLLESLFKSIEHAPSSYSTFRFEMVYPPIPAQVVLTDLLSGQSAKGAVKP